MSEPRDDLPGEHAPFTDAEIGALVERLARRHRSGGRVVERAAILAEGPQAEAILRWISDRDGVAEFAVASTGAKGGLHTARQAPRSTPLRYVLPPAAQYS